MNESQYPETKHTQERKKQHRKLAILPKLVRTGMAVAVVGGTIALSDAMSQNYSSETTPAGHTITLDVDEALSPQRDEIRQFKETAKSKYGIDAKFKYSALYDIPISEISKFPELFRNRYIWNPKPSTPVTEEELNILGEAINTVPFCAKLIGRLIVEKDRMLKNPVDVQSGEYDYVIGVTQPITKDEKGHLILLSIRENSPLNTQTLKYSKLGINTVADSLKNRVFHECGHVISLVLLHATYPKDFFDITDRSRPESEFLIEKKHLLYVPFAKIEGWKIRQEIFDKEVPDGRVYVRDTSDTRMILGYTKSDVEEHFAELFGLYISNSAALSPEERKFFGKIQKGFETKPEEFAKQVAEDPMILLKD